MWVKAGHGEGTLTAVQVLTQMNDQTQTRMHGGHAVGSCYLTEWVENSNVDKAAEHMQIG